MPDMQAIIAAERARVAAEIMADFPMTADLMARATKVVAERLAAKGEVSSAPTTYDAITADDITVLGGGLYRVALHAETRCVWGHPAYPGGYKIVKIGLSVHIRG